MKNMKNSVLSLIILSGSLVLGGCSGMGPNEATGTALGGVTGAVIGGAATNSAVGAGVGAVAGGFIGNRIGAGYDY